MEDETYTKNKHLNAEINTQLCVNMHIAVKIHEQIVFGEKNK